MRRGLDGGLLELRSTTMTLQATDNIAIQSDKAWVVYDAQTGRIHHVHRVITLQGGVEPNPREIEDRVMAIADERGMPRAQVRMLAVSPAQLQPGARHRIDPTQGTLVSEPLEANET